jgi:hypothetical protein
LGLKKSELSIRFCNLPPMFEICESKEIIHQNIHSLYLQIKRSVKGREIN